MIKRILEWLLSFFQTGKEKELNEEIKVIDEKLEKIDEKEYSDSERFDLLNK